MLKEGEHGTSFIAAVFRNPLRKVWHVSSTALAERKQEEPSSFHKVSYYKEYFSKMAMRRTLMKLAPGHYRADVQPALKKVNILISRWNFP
jgi:hypothetical protein